MSIARFVTWGGTGILTTETQDFGLIIKYGVSEKVYQVNFGRILERVAASPLQFTELRFYRKNP